MQLRKLTLIAIGALLSALSVTAASVQGVNPVIARNVILVHGAGADGSSWSEITSRLQAAGLNVVAVQNPLTSLSESLAATRRALAMLEGSTVLVGHSRRGTHLVDLGRNADELSYCELLIFDVIGFA